jgi:hypothetical protein
MVIFGQGESNQRLAPLPEKYARIDQYGAKMKVMATVFQCLSNEWGVTFA